MSIIEFRRLIKKLQQHNISALQDIYDNFFSKIYYFALSKVKSEQDAYDIAMGVIVKLTEYKGDVQEIKNHIGLMITMTQNMVNDYYRRRRRLICALWGFRFWSRYLV